MTNQWKPMTTAESSPAVPTISKSHELDGTPSSMVRSLDNAKSKMSAIVDASLIGKKWPPHHVRVSTTTSVASDLSSASDTSRSLRTEYTGPIIPPLQDKSYRRRTIVLCFDGTGDQFDLDNSNVVQFFSVLKKGDRKRQLVYYQSGIGTYTIPQVATPVTSRFVKTLDLMFANQLHHHVMGGYRFLMENYKEGDKICIFGFSRGAYTARALAGMIHKVGLLPAGNEQQVPFAYKMFSSDSERGWSQSVAFKKTFCMDIDVDFVGVWDTVASVGLFPKTLPFTKSNTAIKVFRHALSLDEHRSKFVPSVWQKITAAEAKRGDYTPPPSQNASPAPVTRGRRCKETERDAVPRLKPIVGPPLNRASTRIHPGKPDFESSRKHVSRAKTGPAVSTVPTFQRLGRSSSEKGPGRRSGSSSLAREVLDQFKRSCQNVSENVAEVVERVSLDLERSLSRDHVRNSDDEDTPSPEAQKDLMEQMYMDRSRPTDVLEVWFAGCHCDVGGGSVPNNTPNSLARIPLRWMIRECFLARTGIQFEADKLRDLGMDPHTLYPRVLDEKPDWLKAEYHDHHCTQTKEESEKTGHGSASSHASNSISHSRMQDHTDLSFVQSREKEALVQKDVTPEVIRLTPEEKQAVPGHSRQKNISLGTTLVDAAESKESLDPPRVEVQRASVIDLTSVAEVEATSAHLREEHGNSDEKKTDHTDHPSKYLSSDHAGGLKANKPLNPMHFETEATNIDARTKVYDQLKLKRWWWLLEYLPMRERRQNTDGSWKKKWHINRGRSRIVPQEDPLYVHHSVKLRMDDPGLRYEPKLRFAKPPVYV